MGLDTFIVPTIGAKDPGGIATAFAGGSGRKDGGYGGKDGGCGGKVGGANVVAAFWPLCNLLKGPKTQEHSEINKTSKLKKVIMTQSDHHFEKGVL